MSSILSLLKILSIPVAIAALHQLVLVSLSGLKLMGAAKDLMLTSSEMARSQFVSQATLALILTFFVGLPFLRYHARRRELGYPIWMAAWTLVHLPAIGFSGMANLIVEWHWMIFLSLIGSLLAVTGLWWKMFYAERTPVMKSVA